MGVHTNFVRERAKGLTLGLYSPRKEWSGKSGRRATKLGGIKEGLDGRTGKDRVGDFIKIC